MTRRPLYVRLYLSVALAVILGGSFVNVFQLYVATDFGSIATFIRENREFLSMFADENVHDDPGFEREMEERVERALVPSFESYSRRMRFSGRGPVYWIVIACGFPDSSRSRVRIPGRRRTGGAYRVVCYFRRTRGQFNLNLTSTCIRNTSPNGYSRVPTAIA